MYRGPEADSQPARYHVALVDTPIDALLDGQAWDRAESVTWGPPGFATTFRALWRTDGLAVRWDAEDASPWATRTQRDDCLWETEVVEVFLDPTRSGEDYAELEITPANVVCDLHIERLEPERRVHLAWDFAGLRTRVHRAPASDDWTAIAWMPFDDFATISPRVAPCVPVVAGDTWHFNAFRIKRPGGPERPEDGVVYAAWSVPDGPSFHAPSFFRPLVFAGRAERDTR